MTKQEFISALRARLYGLPAEEIEERLAFYGEVIDDRCEEGLSEEEAVDAIGSLDSIAFEIVGEIPLGKIVKERVKRKRRFKTWEILLLSLGAPVWVTLLVALFAVALSLYAALWSIVASLWAVFASLALSAPVAVLASVLTAFGSITDGVFMFGAALVLAGLAIFLFFGALWATKGILCFTKRMVFAVKWCFVKKEEAK